MRAQPAFDAEAVLRKMTATLTPRGPDGEGYYLTPAVALGHRRLSIIDLEGGGQPMSTPDGRYHIVYNGELYNYVELRQDLEAQGVTFTTRSDTEVLLHSFVRERWAALARFNGMFAFAIWDQQEEALYLARDRMGKKPLYYCCLDRDLVFASELKALLQYPGVSREINPLSISKYFTYNYVPAPHTIFQHIRKLEPGYYLTFNGGACDKAAYWDIPIEDNPISAGTVDECAAEMLDLLRHAVKIRLRSDVPVGVFLSGGIDSSAITALAAQQCGRQVHTFSIGFEESSYDESPYAREVARLYNTAHHHEVLSAQRALDILPTVMKILDEPFGDASILPTYLLSQFTAQSVKVALGGDGGDELYIGYPAFQAHHLMEKLSILPVTWRDALVRWARRLPVSHKYASLEFLLQQFFKGAGISPEIRFFLWMGCYGNEQKKKLFTPEFRARLLHQNPYEDIINYVRQSGLVRDFARLQYLCMKLYMQDDILVKVDRASMANSLEVRAPFLDYRVVEQAAAIDPIYKLKGATTKYILKRAMAPLLPRRIIKRRKAGFMIPLATWLSGALRSMVEELCSESMLRRDGYFDPRVVRQMLDDHYAARRDYRKMIWTLLAFQIWRHNYGP